jgi:hypothetical protein
MGKIPKNLPTGSSSFEQHFGTPKPEEKRAFTRVLQGHIAIDTAVFPSGTTGFMLCVPSPFLDIDLTAFHQRLVGSQITVERWTRWVVHPLLRDNTLTVISNRN